jgi:hypothetical protein
MLSLLDADDLIGGQSIAALAEEAAKNRRLAAKHIKALAHYFRSGKKVITNEYYNLLRVASSRIDGRDQVAEFWKNRLEAFEKQLASLRKVEDLLKEAGDIPHRRLLLSAIKGWIKATEEMVDVIRSHYELHA